MAGAFTNIWKFPKNFNLVSSVHRITKQFRRRNFALEAKAANVSPLLSPEFKYVGIINGKTTLEDYSEEEWNILTKQRIIYDKSQRAQQALDMLLSSKNASTYGYPINNYQHCLQSATKVYRDMLLNKSLCNGQYKIDEELIVLSLFHDLFFIISNENHADCVATLFKPFIKNERNYFMLKYHDKFQLIHLKNFNGLTDEEKKIAYKKWSKYPWYQYTKEWVEKYDQDGVDPYYENEPIDTFIPMVYRFFNC